MGIIKNALDSIQLNITVRAAMPGHKGKITVSGSHDVTELPGMDNLQDPQGILQAAQEAAAKIYGTALARFLVNGSTCGNLAMIFSFFNEGDAVLLERNCHKSVYNGVLLRKLEPHYLWPETDEYQNSLPQSPIAIRDALESNPGIKGIILTQPSYKGCFSDFKAIWQIAQDYGVYLLLDAAHGAHLAGMTEFRDFYTSCDAMVVSTHKSMDCLNQGAVLLLNRPEFAQKILKYSNMFQTTSPSYLILESIEHSLEGLEAGKYLDPPDFRNQSYHNLTLNPLLPGMRMDPWKLLIHAKNQGAVMETYLEEEGIYPEAHDPNSVLLMLSPFNTLAEVDVLKKVLVQMDEAFANNARERADSKDLNQDQDFIRDLVGKTEVYPKPPRRVLPPHLVGDDYIELDLDQSVGHIVQEQVIPYPPGVPVLVPGEVIDADMIAYLKHLITQNVVILGLTNNQLKCRKGGV